MIKTKHILIALAVIGANVLHHMPVHKAFAVTTVPYWYGTTDGFVYMLPDPAVVSGVNLTIDDTTCNIDDTPKQANLVSDSIYGGYTIGNDTVSNNSLTIALNSIQVTANIYAGYSVNGEASGNKLIINSGTINGSGKSVCGGYSEGSGKVSKNEVTINGGTLGGSGSYVYGGYSVSGEVSENKLFINNVTINRNVYGGRANGVASKNEVTIKNSTITGEVYGGCSNGSGEVSRNKIITDSSTISGNVNGGYSQSGNAIRNEVTINSGTINGTGAKVYGGISGSGQANLNKVTINGGTINNDVYGGCSFASSYVNSNKVIITGGTINANVYGGSTNSGDATNNSINIEGGTFNNVMLYGGKGTTSTVNTLNLKTVINGTISKVADFQNVNFTIPAGMDREMPMLKVTTNPMALDGVTFDVQNWSDGDYITLVKGVNGSAGALEGHTNFYVLDIGGTKELVYANGTPTAKADYTIKQGSKKFDSAATAGTYDSEIKGNTTAGGLSDTSYSGNEIIIRRGTYTGFIDVAKTSGNETVSNNIIKIYDGTINSPNMSAGYSTGTGTVSGNIVIINGGTFSKQVSGGYVYSGTAKDNIVTINGGTFGSTVQLHGGVSNVSSSGNVLNLNTKIGDRVQNVDYFQKMNFTLPAGIANGDTMLKTTTMTFDTTNKTAINVYAANGVTLKKDDVITLIDATNVFGADDYKKGTILGGAAELVNKNDENKILQIVLLRDFEQKAPAPSAGGEDQQKAPVEGVAAAAVIVNASADLASGQGMASLVANTAGGTTDTFGAMSAGNSKYKTGSHVDVDGWGMLVGAGKTKEWKNGTATTYGIFFEYGKGDFDTYNGNVHGDGNSENKGVGIMARHKLTNNTYYEGNIRFGKQETEWGESELGSYDTDSRYYGISVGVGHIYPVGKNEIDVYGRYTYGHVGACDATLKDSKYHFDSVKSHRVRVGGKYNFKVKDSNAKPYVGLAWEHEFKGEARASISGVGEAPAPSMKGNTGIMEVGCDWKVSKKWTVGLGANAYMGKRKGWDGMARVFYNF